MDKIISEVNCIVQNLKKLEEGWTDRKPKSSSLKTKIKAQLSLL